MCAGCHVICSTFTVTLHLIKYSTDIVSLLPFSFQFLCFCADSLCMQELCSLSVLGCYLEYTMCAVSSPLVLALDVISITIERKEGRKKIKTRTVYNNHILLQNK